MTGEQPSVDREALRAITARLAAEIGHDHPGGVVLIGLLKGSIHLLADVARALTVPAEIDFLALSAYRPGASRIRIVKDLDLDISTKQVVLVTDIVDTGLSTMYVVDLLRDRGAAEVRVCTLVDRRSRRILPLAPDYVGFEAGPDYLIGYGMDHEERFRNVRDIYALHLPVRQEDLDSLASAVFATGPL